MSTARIKTGDIVVVITGRGGDSEKAFKGKTGKVLAVNAKRGVAIVEGIHPDYVAPRQLTPLKVILLQLGYVHPALVALDLL